MSPKRSRPIGVFDSGIGGLTVVKQILKQFPEEEIIYFGDTARVPYGNKSAQTIIRFSLENVKFLLNFKVKFIIVACNTSASLALNTLRRTFNVPFLGVVSPAVKRAVGVSSSGRIGIIGTRATIASRCYQREIAKIKPTVKAFAVACPLFVPLVEEGWLTDRITLQVAGKYLEPLLKKKIDTLILGCTHYPMLKRIIRKAVGEGINFVDSAKETAQMAKSIMIKKALCVDSITANPSALTARPDYRLAKCKFYISDASERFREIGSRFLGQPIEYVQCMQ